MANINNADNKAAMETLFESLRLDIALLRTFLTFLTASETFDAASIADGDEVAEEITVTGAALGDFVLVSHSLDVADLAITAAVTAANTVTYQLLNNTGGAVDLASGTVKVLVLPAASFGAALPAINTTNS